MCCNGECNQDWTGLDCESSWFLSCLVRAELSLAINGWKYGQCNESPEVPNETNCPVQNTMAALRFVVSMAVSLTWAAGCGMYVLGWDGLFCVAAMRLRCVALRCVALLCCAGAGAVL